SLDLSLLPGRFPYVLVTPQYETERVLRERALAEGAEIVYGAEVVGWRRRPAGVDVEVRASGGGAQTGRASYVVGADGVRSTVRRALGLPFPGQAAVRSVMLADVRLEDAPAGVLTVNAVGDAFAFLAPFGDGWYRVVAWDRRHQPPDTEPVGLDELREVTRRALGTDHGMHSPRWTSRFHSDERQAPKYPVGRVSLAGHDAHLPPRRPGRAARGHAPRPRHRPRHALPALDVAVPQRRAAGAEVPGRPGVPRGRRRARPLPGGRAGHEHRDAGRREPRLEAGGGA